MKALALRLSASAVLVLLLIVGSAPTAEAVPFTITSVLTGDLRPENPDNLIVDVTINGDTTSNATSWTLDINSPQHPNISLGGFFFNLAVNPTLLSFANFSPTAWSVSYTTHQAQGSGGARFQFAANDPSGPSNNVTNSVNLTFTARLSSGTWSEAMFLNAPLSDGAGTVDPGVQLGAHLRSLSTAGCSTCNTDSGFAGGNYSGPPTSVPEPASFMLIGLGVAAFVATRRRSL